MSCSSVATATEFTTITSDSLSTSFSDSISTLPATTTTIDSLSCVPTTTGNVTTSSCSTVETVSTIAGGTTTVQVPVVLTIPVTTSSPTATLFSTTCSSTSDISPTDTPTSTSTSVVTTTVATTVTFQSSFTSDGSVIFTSGTSVSSIVTQSTQTSLVTGTPSSHESSNTSAIVGGAVGGGIGAIILSLVAWFLLRRHRRYDFDDDLLFPDAIHDDHNSKNVLRRNGEKGAVIDAEPRPYTYGALSSAGPSSTAHTPSNEGAPGGAGYGRPAAGPPLQMGQSNNLPAAPYPMPMPAQSYPSHSGMSSPSGSGGPYTSNQSLPMPLAAPPPSSASPSAAASTSTATNPGGYDPRRPLHVVNDYPGQPMGSVPPHLAAAMQGYLPSQSEKAQAYHHPQTGLTMVPERPEASGSHTYVPAVPHGPGSPGAQWANANAGPIPSSAPVSQPDPPRLPVVAKDAGRANAAGGPAASGAGAADNDVPPPAYSE
ncbi:hypothetical protein ACG7TL_003236 [Trametes sanguinea]